MWSVNYKVNVLLHNVSRGVYSKSTYFLSSTFTLLLFLLCIKQKDQTAQHAMVHPYLNIKAHGIQANYILVIKGRIKLQKDICTWKLLIQKKKKLSSNFFGPCSVIVSQIYMYKATNPKKGSSLHFIKRINLLHIVPCLLCTNYLVLKDCLRVFKWMHHYNHRIMIRSNQNATERQIHNSSLFMYCAVKIKKNVNICHDFFFQNGID